MSDKTSNEASPQPIPEVLPFLVGEVVQLKSGGGLLTVTEVEADQVGATGVCEDGKVERVWLPAVCFAHYEGTA